MSASLLVAASNFGGGIGRHVELTSRFVDFTVLQLPETLSLPAKIRQLRARLRDQQPTLLVTHGVAAGLAARHRGRSHGMRHVEFWHNDPFFLTPRRRAAFHALARSGRAPDSQVFVYAGLMPRYRDPRSDSVVIPNSVAIPQTPRQWIRSSEDCRRAVYVGRLSPEKGFRDLLAAWPADAPDRGWTLEVFGDASADNALVPSGILLKGYTDEPLTVLSGADLLVVPSWVEASPYVALEAASVGLPIVATTAGDLPLLLASGCGWSVPPRDTAALRRAIEAAQRCPEEELSRRGRLGRRWLERHRSFAQWQHAVAAVYQS